VPRKPPAIATVNSIEPTEGNNTPILSKTEKRLESRLSALDKHNVTDERLAKAIDEGLNAGKVVEDLVQGQIVERIEPDYNVRQKYLDIGMRARDWGVVDKVSVNVDARRVISLTAEDRMALEGIVRKMKELNSVLDMGDVQDGEIVDNTLTGGVTG
jgi:hypothetical protein